MSKEEWRDVVGWEGLYQVSNQGKVRSVTRGRNTYIGRCLSAATTTKGYHRVTLSLNGVDKKAHVHRLVAEAFIGLRPDGYEVNHRNGNKTDNRPSNLQYVTPSENIRHSIDVLGNGPAKLSDDQVLQIRRLLKTGVTMKEIGHIFGVTSSTIRAISIGKTWRHVK